MLAVEQRVGRICMIWASIDQRLDLLLVDLAEIAGLPVTDMPLKKAVGTKIEMRELDDWVEDAYTLISDLHFVTARMHFWVIAVREMDNTGLG